MRRVFWIGMTVCLHSAVAAEPTRVASAPVVEVASLHAGLYETSGNGLAVRSAQVSLTPPETTEEVATAQEPDQLTEGSRWLALVVGALGIIWFTGRRRRQL